MKYLSITIENYRAINGPLTIELDKLALIPIIGVNECGKSTILQAIAAFDLYNDDTNDNGRHLRDTANLYRTLTRDPVISARIAITASEWLAAIANLKEKDFPITSLRYYKRTINQPTNEITISRNLISKEYSILSDGFKDPKLSHAIATQIIRKLPYILYFDDFRDAVEERITIEDGESSNWLSIMEQLFKQTDKDLSVFHLANMEERRRKSVLSRVKKKLNDTLTKEWQKFRLDESDALEISIEFEKDTKEVLVEAPRSNPNLPRPNPTISKVTQNYLKIDVIEKDLDGNEHYFFIRDRSKGFFWFFNFVMKLEFNPKTVDDDHSAIYLLDEPGSYLHASAQTKLCNKLRQLSERNKVLYCTHSHYLLDPEIIPINSIRIADKDGNGGVTLTPIHDHTGNILERRSAFQPLIDALQIKPFLLDLTPNRVLITEGIYDYFCFEMFKGGRNFNVLPSVGADSIKFYISILIAWRVRYAALWDNDKKGNESRTKAVSMFGDEEAKNFFVLPAAVDQNKRVLEDLIDQTDIDLIKMELMIPANAAFEKCIASLYYAPNRQQILNKISSVTKQNFEEVYAAIRL